MNDWAAFTAYCAIYGAHFDHMVNWKQPGPSRVLPPSRFWLVKAGAIYWFWMVTCGAIEGVHVSNLCAFDLIQLDLKSQMS